MISHRNHNLVVNSPLIICWDIRRKPFSHLNVIFYIITNRDLRHFDFHLKLFQIKVISQDHCAVAYKNSKWVWSGNTTITNRWSFESERSRFYIEVSKSVWMSDWLGEREFEISSLKDWPIKVSAKLISCIPLFCLAFFAIALVTAQEG